MKTTQFFTIIWEKESEDKWSRGMGEGGHEIVARSKNQLDVTRKETNIKETELKQWTKRNK